MHYSRLRSGELWRWRNRDRREDSEIVVATRSISEGDPASPTNRSAIHIDLLGIARDRIPRREWNRYVTFWFDKIYTLLEELADDDKITFVRPKQMGWLTIKNVHIRIHEDARVTVDQELDQGKTFFTVLTILRT